MGLDVNLYAEGAVTDDELKNAQSVFASRSTMGYDTECSRSTWHPMRVERHTLTRYYGEGYERGPWPNIYGDIMLMRAVFPNCTIHYGSDSSEDCMEASDERMAELWAHFTGPDGDAYRAR